MTHFIDVFLRDPEDGNTPVEVEEVATVTSGEINLIDLVFRDTDITDGATTSQHVQHVHHVQHIQTSNSTDQVDKGQVYWLQTVLCC